MAVSNRARPPANRHRDRAGDDRHSPVRTPGVLATRTMLDIRMAQPSELPGSAHAARADAVQGHARHPEHARRDGAESIANIALTCVIF